VNRFLLENTDILKSSNLSPILTQAGLEALLSIRTLMISLLFPVNLYTTNNHAAGENQSCILGSENHFPMLISNDVGSINGR
jgi:hypothetical protein